MPLQILGAIAIVGIKHPGVWRRNNLKTAERRCISTSFQLIRQNSYDDYDNVFKEQ